MNIKTKIMKLLEESIEYLHDLKVAKGLLSQCTHKESMSYLDFIRSKACSLKDTTNKPAIDEDKVFTKYVSDDGIVSRKYLKYISTINWNELLLNRKIWMDFKCIILSERSQNDKATYFIISFIQVKRQNYTNKMRSVFART